jgi:hypothetical protein
MQRNETYLYTLPRTCKMTAFKVSNMPTLGTAKWNDWMRKANAYFRMNSLYEIINNAEKAPTNEKLRADYMKRRGQAARFISMFIDSTNATYMKDIEDDPAKMWTKLEDIHNAKTPVMRFNALDTLYSIRKDDDESLCSLMTRAETAMNEYKSLVPANGSFMLQMMQEEIITMTLICALPAELNHIRSSLNIHAGLTLAVTQQAVIAEDNQSQCTALPTESALQTYSHYCQQSNAPSTSSYPEARIDTRSESRVDTHTCFHCHKQGHIARHCPTKKAEEAARRNAAARITSTAGPAPPAEAFAVNARTIPIPAAACSDLNCDTGATNLMMGNEEFFTSLRPLVREIRLANGASIKSKGEGKVIFQPWVNGNFSSKFITFPNVLFAPDLQSNLVSVLTMVRKHGYEVHINDKQMEFYQKGEL